LNFLLSVSLVSLLLVGQSYAGQNRFAASQSATPGQATAQAASAPPATLSQLPATAPQVSFQRGQLTISAQNSTLGDILKAVRVQTGATIEYPGTAPERVVGQFGPAPARDVLALLLNGSHFNYLLLGSPTDPSALDRVILLAKSSGSLDTSQAPAEQASAPPVYTNPHVMAPMAAPAGMGGANTVVVEGQDATADATDDSADATDDSADDQSDQTDQTDQTDDQAATDDQQQQQDGQQNVKTPEQLLQELQQRQQQLQQQGAQPGAVPGGFPTPGNPGIPGGQPGVPPHN
jgi:hypothetical protein